MTVILLVAVLGVAALAIDVSAGYLTKRQAQTAADAAALAAVQDLPDNPNGAATQAQSYVSQNIPGATTSVTTPFNGKSDEIQVTVTKTAPSFFAGVLGVGSYKVTSSAVAFVKWHTTCSNPGNTCYAIFAMDTSCSGNPVFFGGGTHITGAIDSNGSLSVGGGSTFGPTTYGNATGCVVRPSGYQQQNNTFTSGPTPQPATSVWPADYSVDFPACSGAACTGPLGTPSFCTQASTAGSWTLQAFTPVNLTSGNIYCAVGSGIPSSPSTWNGALTISTSSKVTITATFVAGTVYLSGGDHLVACGYTSSGYSASTCTSSVPAPDTTNYPIIYAVGAGTASSPAIDNTPGGGTFTGDMFAPNGTIDMGGGDNTHSFLEGNDVIIPGGGFTGDGPTTGGSTSAFATALIQ